MKKAMAIFLAAIMTLTCVGCGGAKAGEATKTLYDQGLELVALLKEMADSEEYLAVYSGSTELMQVVAAAAEGDYTEPAAVYEIKLSEETLEAMAELADMEGMSRGLRDYTKSRIQGTFVTQINAMGGANMLAASSICTAGKTFVAKEAQSTMYLYTYGEGVPVFVTFTAGEGGAMAASASFVFYEDFKADTEQDLEAFFGEVSAEVVQVTK